MVSYHLQERRRIARRYIQNLDPLVAGGYLQLPASIPGFDGTYWLFSAVLVNGNEQRRDQVMKLLSEQYGIETRPFFVPMHHLPMYKTSTTFPVSEFLSAHGLNFPTYTGLANHEIDEICEAVSSLVRKTA
jgi:perosamine synthetase